HPTPSPVRTLAFSGSLQSASCCALAPRRAACGAGAAASVLPCASAWTPLSYSVRSAVAGAALAAGACFLPPRQVHPRSAPRPPPGGLVVIGGPAGSRPRG